MQFAHGDRVRLTQDCAQIHLPGPFTPKKGETGRVAKLYRVQDGLEIYQVVLDRGGYTFAAIANTQMQKIDDSSDLVKAFLNQEYPQTPPTKKEEPEEDEDYSPPGVSFPSFDSPPSDDSSGGGDSGGGGASDDF